MIVVELDMFWNGGSNTHKKMCHLLFTENYGSTEMHLCSRNQVLVCQWFYKRWQMISVSGVFCRSWLRL